ncbi:MAG: DNA-binding protein [Arcobacter sp.]|nr:MAG: DNA-binding protein [Arcobacter sp.]
MERLVTTAQAAELLNISLQGVHYRIKSKKLKSIKQGNKTFVYIEDIPALPLKEIKETIQENKELPLILEIKDEQILLLKKSLKWMKKQYISEISRLEKNQDKIINVFNREIELLQSAFNEMRLVYKKPLLEQKNKYISVLDFSSYLKQNGKNSQEIKMIVLDALKRKDRRFMFNKKSKKVLILNEDYSDLL